MKAFYILIFSIVSNFLLAQGPEQQVLTFFKKMNHADTSGMRALFTKNASLQSSVLDKSLKRVISNGTIDQFITSISGFKKGSLDERISNVNVQDYNGMAIVTMDYDLFLDGKFRHRGVNAFNFLLDKTDWKIASITDTRSVLTKKEERIKTADILMDEWHAAAAKADSAGYFGKMHKESIYVGTDSSEVWTLDQYLGYAAPYFAKGNAWSFSKISRNLRYEESMDMVWFDEVLDTWMGPCRGSGFLIPDETGLLKIKHYVLSVTVPNDKIYDVMKAAGVEKKK